MIHRALIRIICLGLMVLGAAACSPKKFAVNQFGNAISGGSSVYLSDNDPELVREAIPFGLKTYESLLEVTPNHRGLLLSAASGFTSYAYLLQQEADLIDYDDYRRARHLRERAAKLYLRGRDFALRGLALRHPDFTENLLADPEATLAEAGPKDIPFLYWAGAAWAGALSADKNDTGLIAALPIAGALLLRVVELDETFDEGAAYDLLLSYEANRPGGDLELARSYYDRALELSGGKRAGLYLTLAESIAVQEQNLAEFEQLVALALAVDADATPNLRLVNTLAHQRAEWLQTTTPDLFFEVD